MRIVGLTTSGLHLNDTSATVICWDSKLGRWRLRIADGKTAAVQPRNVEAVADDAFAGPPATLGATEGATEFEASAPNGDDDTPASAAPTIIELDAVPDVIDLTASAASSEISKLLTLYDEQVDRSSASYAIDVNDVQQPAACAAASSSSTTAVDLVADDNETDRPAGKRPKHATSAAASERRHVRVDVCGVPRPVSLTLRLEARIPLIYLYQVEVIQLALRSLWVAGKQPPTSVLQLARHFRMVSGARRIDAVEAQSATCAALVRGVGREYLLRFEPATLVQKTLRDSTAGGLDAVEIVRFDFMKPPPQFDQFHQLVGGRIRGMRGGSNGSSPIVLLKNFNQDRGLSLFRTIYQQEPPPPHYGPHQHSIAAANHAAIHRAADRALDVCKYAMLERSQQRACDALKQRSPYNMTVARSYQQGTNQLPHHVDGLGGWVVLFSFGLTVDFFVGHKTLCIESGDALIFNGAPEHGVDHGFTHPVRADATCRGRPMTLVGMVQIDGLRFAVQARQRGR